MRARDSDNSDKRRRTGWPPVLRVSSYLALIPFLLLSLIAQGTMLDRGRQGGMTVVLCMGDDIVQAVMGPDGTLSDQPARDDGHGSCHWAPHFQQLLEAGGGAAPMIAPDLWRTACFSGQAGHLHLADMPASMARGPPALV